MDKSEASKRPLLEEEETRFDVCFDVFLMVPIISFVDTLFNVEDQHMIESVRGLQ